MQDGEHGSTRDHKRRLLLPGCGGTTRGPMRSEQSADRRREAGHRAHAFIRVSG